MSAAASRRPTRGGPGPGPRLAAPGDEPPSRMQRWLLARQPKTDTLLLTQRNVYILPTRAGWLFALTLLVLLVASINYQLNLGYVLTFLLTGSGAVSMHLTHATLRGLTLRLKPVAPIFAGEPAMLDVVVTSPGSARYGIALRLAAATDGSATWFDVPAHGQAAAQVSFVPAARGFQGVPAMVASTRFPLGLFRTWSVWRPAAQLLVYPAPERPAAALPAARPVPGGPMLARSGDSGEVDGVRAYRRGDTLKQVAWKKSAQSLDAGGGLVSRDTSAAAHLELWLDWQACVGLDPEARLSRLTAWVLAAHRSGSAYGMRVPGQEITPASGDAQKRQCLGALALWR